MTSVATILTATSRAGCLPALATARPFRSRCSIIGSTPLDGSAPLLLYGYGSYGDALQAEFSAPRLSLVDRGFIFALAHVRGGNDKGQRWQRGGTGDNKPNCI